jgi:hypothetical protein
MSSRNGVLAGRRIAPADQTKQSVGWCYCGRWLEGRAVCTDPLPQCVDRSWIAQHYGPEQAEADDQDLILERAERRQLFPAPSVPTERLLAALIALIAAVGITCLAIAACLGDDITAGHVPRCVRIAGAIDVTGTCRP